MKAEQAKKLTDKALAQLAEALEDGKSDAMLAYLTAMSRFHHYSFGNIMLIASQRPDATRVAGFRTWKKLHRYVKKGEKGIVIIAPMVCKKKDGDAYEQQDRASDSDAYIRFKAVYVFDVAQTDGEALPEPTRITGHPRDYLKRLGEYVSKTKHVLVVFDHLPPGVDGMSSGGTIRLRAGLSPAEEFSVLVHELAHELLHHGDNGTRPSKTVRETEAEAVAFVVSQAIGLKNGTASSDYIQLYAGDKGTLAGSLDRIQKTACAIIEAITTQDAVVEAETAA